MNRESNTPFGAFIERGEILTEESAEYTVKSFDRDGIITPPIKAINNSYDVGDHVFFFMFNDGSGQIIGKIE